MTDLESRSKARRIANERNLAALANDTKWREFFGKTREAEIQLQIKYIDVDKPTDPGLVWMPATNYLEGIGSGGPYLFVWVEWVRSNNINQVSKIAEEVGLVWEAESKNVTVFGYK